MKGQSGRGFGSVHAALILLAHAPLFAKLLPISPTLIILGRCFFGAIALFVYLRLRGGSEEPETWSGFLRQAPIGVVLAVHWVSYFYSIRISSVAIGMVSLYTFPIMTSILEPIILRTRFDWLDLPLLAWILGGIALMAPAWDLNDATFQGLLIGLFSAGLFALRNVLSKRLLARASGARLLLNQLAIAFVVLVPFVPDYTAVLDWRHLLGLAVLGVIVTAIAHTLWINGMRHLRATTVALLSCTGPVFGVLLAALYLDEIPEPRTIVGGAVVLAGVLFEMVRRARASSAASGADSTQD